MKKCGQLEFWHYTWGVDSDKAVNTAPDLSHW
jgi:hypothetical protein